MHTLCAHSSHAIEKDIFRYGDTINSEVTPLDVAQFESRWQRPIVRIRHFASSAASAAAAATAAAAAPSNSVHNNNNSGRAADDGGAEEVALALNLVVEQLWVAQQRLQQRVIDPALI